MRTIATTSTLALLALTAGCGGGEPPAATPPTPSATVAPPPATTPIPVASTRPAQPAPTRERADRHVVEARACCSGGLWGDALGEEGEMKRTGDERRCRDVAQMT